jgi:hypothetical protein
VEVTVGQNIKISSLTDLRVWASNRGGLNERECNRLADLIADDSEHPAWGSYWTEYLAEIDIAATIASDAVAKIRVIDPDSQCPEHGCARWRCDAEHT